MCTNWQNGQREGRDNEQPHLFIDLGKISLQIRRNTIKKTFYIKRKNKTNKRKHRITIPYN